MSTTLDQTLAAALEIDGATAVALVDYESGMSLGHQGTGIDLDVAAAGNTEVIRAKLRTMAALGLDDRIEDILITLGQQYHLIRLLQGADGTGLFPYLGVDTSRPNRAGARRLLTTPARPLTI
ncbi:hypothetical protein [uncultured Cellulomonas sp.]|uniref:hypothetical protein n=1 Tax=uncultured Cellulomonas sp. TaxID=189682 RepID=UPI0028EF1C28|nr:hypothetical protein [uncultured Cellulomonas sp.]